MGTKYPGLLLIFLLPFFVSSASAAIYVENASSFDFSLNAAPPGLSSSLDGIQPRIFTEDVDSLFGKKIIVAPSGLDISLNAVRPRIFTEHLDSLFDNNLNNIPSELDSSITAVRPRIFIEHIDSLWYPHYMGAPIPLPLVANITLPTNDFYSEELVNFSANISGGTPPYTFVWTSDKAGTLNTTTTSSTLNEFSKLLAFNNITPEMNKHTINLTVQDSAGNNVTKTGELNVVKQKIKILVVPIATSDSELSAENKIIINTLADESKEFYLKSSYGAIYLDFDTSFNSVVNVVKSDVNSVGDSVLVDTVKQLQIPPYSLDLSKHEIIVIVNTENLALAGGYTSLLTGVLAEGQLLPTAVVPFGVSFSYAIWVHEIGHALGYSVETSETYNKPALLWSGSECNDLYNCGNVNAWDIMALGGYVFKSAESGGINQPTDMSVLSKTKLRWLKKEVVTTLPFERQIVSTENMRYENSALVYKPSLSSNVEYYIEARELEQPSYYKPYKDLPYWSQIHNGMLIYRVIHQDDGTITYNFVPSWSNIIFGPTFSASDGTSAEGTDLTQFIKFSVVASDINHPYNAKIRIEPCDSYCAVLKGAIMDVSSFLGFKTGGAFSAGNGTIPDLDLHAVTPDGSHIGMNYSSGEYEMQIPGGVSSGDTIGEEWIFVPTGTEVRYYIDSHDVQKFLEEHPDVDPANATMNYSTSFMEYGENPQRLELPDGNWTVTNRTVSEPQNDIIEPGVIKEIVPETPVSITNLTFEAGATWLNFTWLNPPDPDFSHVMLYLNGTFKNSVPAPQNYYNFTGLTPNTSYELGTHTVDSSGNVNETWVNATARTLPPNVGNINFTLPLKTGWNMVSLPIIPDDPSVNAIFGSNVTTVYGWTGTSYVLRNELEPKKGYWVLSSSNYEITVTGTPVFDRNITLAGGWNMVGPVTNGITISSLPNVTTVYGWTGTSYTILSSSDTLTLTRGYWILANATSIIQV